MDVSFSPDGQHIAVCSSVNGKGVLQSYKTEDGSTVYTVPSTTSGLYALDYSPDGQRIAVSGFDGMIRLYQASDGKTLLEFPSAPLE